MITKSFDRDEKNLIIINSLAQFSSSMAGIFITVFLFQRSDFKVVLLYNLLLYANLLLWYFLSGKTLKIFSSAFLLKISLFSAAFYYLLLFLLKEKIVFYVIPLAFLNGFSAGNYWSAYNLNQYLFSKKERRIKYFGVSAGLVNFLTAIGPLLGGLLVAFGNKHLTGLHSGYALLFFVVFLILLGLFVFVGKLPKHSAPKFSFKDFFQPRAKRWLLILLQQAFLGFYDVLLGTIAAILSFLILKNELTLGLTKTTNLLLAAFGSFLAVKFLSKKEKFFWLGSLGVFFSILFFAFNQNLFGLLIFIIFSGLTAPFLTTLLSVVYFDCLDDHWQAWQKKYYLMIERDLVLGLSRIASYGFLYLFINSTSQIAMAKNFLFLLSLFPLILGFLLAQWKKIIHINKRSFCK